LNLQDFIRLLRSRWVTVCVTALITILGAVAFTLLQTPLYQASTRLFVSTSAGDSANDLYQSSRYSQERVLSYTQLIMGETLAQRTIDRLDLTMDAAELKEGITAKSGKGTVLIEIFVLDKSPVQARDIANALSDEFVKMVQELETQSQTAKPDARVIVEQRAKIPDEPVVPKKARNLFLGVVLGGILGLGLGFLRDRLDDTVKDRDAVEQITGASTVGVVPFDKSRELEPAISFESDNSAAAEAFRKLRTNLQFLSVDDPPRLIVVSSSMPNEGKSTTAINIALALAEADHNVLLIDGDLRRPSLDRYLDLIGSVGFSTVLSGNASLDEVIQESRYPRLKVLTAGPTPPNPSELLGTLAAKNALRELRDRFDYVIVDSPPLLAVTDGAILAAQADGAIILVRAGKTKREQLNHAIGIFRGVGATVLGSILTMVPTRGSGSYSSDYSYYGRGYGDDKGLQAIVTPPTPNSDIDKPTNEQLKSSEQQPERKQNS
jgi:capsular exopolysaccharide synthesis family protein